MTDDDELIAAELAFGLLAGGEQKDAEARTATDPAFAAAVDRWRGHAAELVSGAGEAPRPSLWSAIEARLPANDVKTADGPSSLNRWRALAIAASLLAAIMTAVAIERRPATMPVTVPAQAPAPLVALLRGTTGQGIIAISFDPAQKRLTLSPAALDPGKHSAELWVIPADGKPRSLGVIDPAAPHTRLPTGIGAEAIAPGATLAVSIEPIGGSPTGQPTGPVILSGTVQRS